MEAFRVTWRLAALSLWTLTVYLLRAAFWVVTFVFPEAERRGRYALFRLWGRGAARIVGMRTEAIGPHPLPPYYLVCNHLTYFDGVVMSAQLGCVFVMMSEVAGWPVLGFLAGQMNSIFVTRQQRRDTVNTNRRILRALERGEGVVMFPEGKTSQGQGILPFKASLIEPAVQRGMPVHYATIRYEALPGSPGASQWVCWGTQTPFTTHVLRALRQPGFRAFVTFGAEPIAGDNRKDLAQRLEAAVGAAFRPIE